MMELGMGVLGWSVDQFWAATHRELIAAVDGWREKNGLRDPEPTKGKGTELRGILNDLMERYPDGD
jgi:uncharacterized phage protein (TIGR02216 family)